MTRRRTSRIAWAASILAHAVVFVAVWNATPSPVAPAVEAEDDFTLVMDAPVEHEPILTVKLTPSTGRPPKPIAVPAVLPGAMLSHIRNRSDDPPLAVEHVVEVRQASATIPAPNPTPMTSERPLHQPLSAGRSVVYVLDCSGTMGLGGKFERARAALLATVAAQPAGVRVKVVTYSRRAVALTSEGVEQLTQSLGEIEPAGESQHVEGVRVALKFEPDTVVLFTDADVAELQTLKPLLAGARKPVSLSVVRVSDVGIASPASLSR